MTLRLAVFASGSGSNLQALMDRFNQKKDGPLSVALVISDRADAGALRRAQAGRVAALTVTHANRSAQDVGEEILSRLHAARIDLIALAGYLRLVPSAVIRAFHNRVVNIHPALLPAFGGKGMYGDNVHRAVLERGCSVTGPTVHYVDERYDEGRIIAQWPVPVQRADTAATLAARVLQVEHMLFPAGLELVARALAARSDQPVCVRFTADTFMTLQQRAPNEAELRRALGLD